MSNGTATIGWDDPQIPIAVGVSIGAGLATGLGGQLVFFPTLLKCVPQAIILAVSLALSAGVMIYVSFIEIFGKSYEAILTTEGVSEAGAAAITTVCFFAGMGFCALLEVVVHFHTPDHEVVCAAPGQTTTASGESGSDKPADPEKGVELEIVGDGAQKKPAAVDDLMKDEAETKALGKMGLMTALAIAIHNFPEGLATFLATVEDTGLGVSLGVAIAIHNIPEGLCVAMPIYYSSGSPCKGFLWSLLSGVTEPIGGILGFAILQPVFTPMVFGIVFAMVGGMMVFIVCHELLPTAHKYMNNGAYTTCALVTGMIIMASSLVLFAL